jgi:hypothetical protein
VPWPPPKASPIFSVLCVSPPTSYS